MLRPSGEKATLVTAPVCPVRTTCSEPLLASHTRTVQSSELLAICRPFGENAVLLTHFLCPIKTHSSLPLSTSHTRNVWSREALTIRCPSGETATLITLFWWPLKTRSFPPIVASHTRTVLSHDPLTIQRPSGESATLVTTPSQLIVNSEGVPKFISGGRCDRIQRAPGVRSVFDCRQFSTNRHILFASGLSQGAFPAFHPVSGSM